ncbi:ATP-binding protein [Verminephrobacter aporrectodeae subsp. tuberculatae]|nr:ATP-binding protein [Verminephrobacter aporrectodeae subsp. tuberculatae]MCW8204235.1 ATP-binding protein [Verminephrobacter aporrectodeae subsp. tuberculatae]
MKFEFKKLGPLDEAVLELADLTIICGENNTGKTYVTYAVYGFLRSWRSSLQRMLAQEIENSVKADGAYKFDLHEMFHGKLNQYFSRLCDRYIRQLPDAFATKKNYFDGVQMKFPVAGELEISEKSFQRTIEGGPAGKVVATLSKESGSNMLELLIADDSWLRPSFQFVADAITEIVFSPLLPDAHISSAERTGAAIFLKELDIARTRLLKALNSMDSKELQESPYRLLMAMRTTGYAWPVEDNVEFIRQLEEMGKQVGPFAEKNPAILEAFDSIIGGSYKVIKDQGLVYQSKDDENSRFSMNESSSCVRALLDVGFYLRCKAEVGDLFIIDEPELNLHPRNQRAFARLIAKMVNAGIKVLVTTHSDYMIKEFNTLIMLAQRTPHTQAMQEKHGYVNEELLNPERVRLYMTGTEKINTLKPAKIYPDRGIEVTTFDTTIDTMNTIQNEILYGGEL